jgi:molybdate transport system permease protein
MIDWFPIQLSLRVAALATLFAVILGLAAGWVLARHR